METVKTLTSGRSFRYIFYRLMGVTVVMVLGLIVMTSRRSSYDRDAHKQPQLIWNKQLLFSERVRVRVHNNATSAQDQTLDLRNNSKIICRESSFVNCGENPDGYEIRISYKRFKKSFKIDLDLDDPLPRGLRAFKRDHTEALKKEVETSGGQPVRHLQKKFRISYYNKPPWKTFFDFKGCPFSNCESAGKATDSSVDMVVVQGELLDTSTPPPQRHAHQLYAMCGWESPNYFYGTKLIAHKTPWNAVFNITMTYRQDADFFLPYRTLAFQGPQRVNLNITEIILKKTKHALALISNCETASNRLQYIKELKKYIDIDLFGKCGDPCPPESGLCDRSNYLAVEEKALEPYLFYLAFENSFCDDYVSEKFFKAYDNNRPMINVARGGADYNKYFPPNTFINAADFKNASELGRHLKRLVDRPEEYFDILKHKMMYRTVHMRNQACMMCEFMNKRDPNVVRSYYDIKEWIGTCRKPPNDVS